MCRGHTRMGRGHEVCRTRPERAARIPNHRLCTTSSPKFGGAKRPVGSRQPKVCRLRPSSAQPTPESAGPALDPFEPPSTRPSAPQNRSSHTRVSSHRPLKTSGQLGRTTGAPGRNAPPPQDRRLTRAHQRCAAAERPQSMLAGGKFQKMWEVDLQSTMGAEILPAPAPPQTIGRGSGLPPTGAGIATGGLS